MAGSSIGTLFRVTTWGESHGAGIGAVVDGCPAGLPLCEEDIQKFLDRRKPGSSQFTTQRKESDCVKILSGVFEAKTTGTPISLMIPNTSQISKDYSNIMDSYRPGHADYGFDSKYGFRDYRGGGRSSGRETAGRVAAGAIAIKLLENFGITFLTYVDQVGPVKIDESRFSVDEITKNALNFLLLMNSQNKIFILMMEIMKPTYQMVNTLQELICIGQVLMNVRSLLIKTNISLAKTKHYAFISQIIQKINKEDE